MSSAIERIVADKWAQGRLEQLRTIAHATHTCNKTDMYAAIDGFRLACKALAPLAHGPQIIGCRVGTGSVSHFFAWVGLSESEVLAKVNDIKDKVNVPLPIKTAERLVKLHLRKLVEESANYHIQIGVKGAPDLTLLMKTFLELITIQQIRDSHHKIECLSRTVRCREAYMDRRKRLADAAKHLTDEQIEAALKDMIALIEVEMVQNT